MALFLVGSLQQSAASSDRREVTDSGAQIWFRGTSLDTPCCGALVHGH